MYPSEYDGDKVKQWAGDSQWRALRADLARFKKWGYSGFGSEGFWALVIYRAQRVINSAKPRLLWFPLRIMLAVVKKLFTLVTHINLEASAEIGPGLLIPHVGPIRIHGEAKIGADCAIHHVVTIGADSRPGGATIGDHVMIGCHSCVLGPVNVGDCANIASGSLVIGDVPAFATAIGVPARILAGRWREKRNPDTKPIPPTTLSTASDDRPALLSAPHVVPRPNRTPFDAVVEHGQLQPARPALTTVMGPGEYSTLTWLQLSQHARWASIEITRLLPHESPVLIYTRRSLECVALMLGAIGAKRAFSCINSRWRWPQIRRILEITSCRTIFVDREGAAVIEKSLAVEDVSKYRLIHVDELHFSRADRDITTGSRSLEPAASDLGCILFTSGSTGEPKGVCISSLDLAWRAQTEAAWYQLTRDDVLVNLLPFSFDVGLNQILAAAYAGCETVLSETWVPGEILQICSDRSVSGIPCVPTIWQDIIDHHLTFDTSGRHKQLRFLTISGGDMPRQYLEKIGAMAPGVNVFKTYGQTEAFRGASLSPDEFASGMETVGRPFPGVTLMIIRSDGTLARRGEAGELVHCGLGVMMGYLGDPERTAEKLRIFPEYSTETLAIFSGDTACIDNAGFVRIVGRGDQMLKVNGNRVYPSEVRSAICNLQGVRDAVVIGLKLPNGAQKIIAYVNAQHGIEVESLKRSMRDSMPNYMVPTLVQLVDDFPRTANGKPDAEALRAQALDTMGKAESLNCEANLSSQLRTVEEIAALIEKLVQLRVDASYRASGRPLREVLDSVSFLDIVTTVDTEMRLGVDFGRLGSDALGTPADLAAALLRSAL